MDSTREGRYIAIEMCCFAPVYFLYILHFIVHCCRNYFQKEKLLAETISSHLKAKYT